MNQMRRFAIRSISGLLGLAGVAACSQTALTKPQPTYTAEEQQRMHKFRGGRGGEWYLSSIDELEYVEILDQSGRYIDALSLAAPRNDRMKGLSEVPIRLKVTWREQDPKNPLYSGKKGESWSGGKITGSFEIPVADRIPDDLLDDLRRDPKGSLRIKIRLHREGVLLGWDIERRPGYDPKKRDQWGSPLYVSAVHSFAGGDFREAEIINGKPVRMGWYIHPRTHERIETDF